MGKTKQSKDKKLETRSTYERERSRRRLLQFKHEKALERQEKQQRDQQLQEHKLQQLQHLQQLKQLREQQRIQQQQQIEQTPRYIQIPQEQLKQITEIVRNSLRKEHDEIKRENTLLKIDLKEKFDKMILEIQKT